MMIKEWKNKKILQQPSWHSEEINQILEQIKDYLFEFILLNFVKKFFEGDRRKRSYYYYTLSQLVHYKLCLSIPC